MSRLLTEKLLHGFHGDVAYGRRPSEKVGVSDPAEDELSNGFGDNTTPLVLQTKDIAFYTGGASIVAWNRASTFGTAVALAPA